MPFGNASPCIVPTFIFMSASFATAAGPVLPEPPLEQHQLLHLAPELHDLRQQLPAPVRRVWPGGAPPGPARPVQVLRQQPEPRGTKELRTR